MIKNLRRLAYAYRYRLRMTSLHGGGGRMDAAWYAVGFVRRTWRWPERKMTRRVL